MYIFLYLLPHLILFLTGYYNYTICGFVLFLSYFIQILDEYAYSMKNNNNMFLSILRYRSTVYKYIANWFYNIDVKYKKNKNYIKFKIYCIKFLRDFDEIINIFFITTTNKIKEKMITSMLFPGESLMMIQGNNMTSINNIGNEHCDHFHGKTKELIGNVD